MQYELWQSNNSLSIPAHIGCHQTSQNSHGKSSLTVLLNELSSFSAASCKCKIETNTKTITYSAYLATRSSVSSCCRMTAHKLTGLECTKWINTSTNMTTNRNACKLSNNLVARNVYRYHYRKRKKYWSKINLGSNGR